MIGKPVTEITTEIMTVQDVNSEYFGVSRRLLMENAGAQVAQFVRQLVREGSQVVIFCGTGGNGGDGLVVGRHLHSHYKVRVVYLGPRSRVSSVPTAKNLEALDRMLDLDLREVRDASEVREIDLSSADLIVDAVLGTGLRHDTLREPVRSLVEVMNECVKAGTPVVAVDVPTGLKRDGTPARQVVRASHTVALHQPKLGTYQYGGEVVVGSIGVPPEAWKYVGPGQFTLLPFRELHSHKGQNGRVVIVGGSAFYHGAPVLAAKAALALGVDLVTLVVPEVVETAVRSLDPSYIVHSYEGRFLTPEVVRSVISPLVGGVDAVLVGPGVGVESITQEAVQQLVRGWNPTSPQLVVDADGLRALRGLQLPPNLILTPHAGEFGLVTGQSLPKDLPQRVNAVLTTISGLGSHVTWLVKGVTDIIARGDQLLLNATGVPEMTAGGTGDVLAGVVLALASQVPDTFLSSSMAAFLVGKAGELVVEDQAFSLEALVRALPITLAEVRKFVREEPNQIYVPS